MAPGDNNTPRNHNSLGENDADRLLGELRTPLTVICGYTQLLQRRLRRGGELRSDYLLARLAVIEQSTRDLEIRLQAVERNRPRRDR